MDDIQEQLAQLRRRIARINVKYKAGTPSTSPAEPLPTDLRPAHYFADEILSGEVVETPLGAHFETERLYERHRRHGSVDLSDLCELPEDLLEAVAGEAIRHSPPTRWAFLDTETTGLAGGAGTVAFLVGVGRICADGFRVRQFFMRDYGEEPSMLTALTRHLEGFEVLVTYNGKTYDGPLLETRYRMARSLPPLGRLSHVDLLHGARRLWKLRFESCRLIDLESQILGVEREGDLPGELIPYVYFEYVRKKQAAKLVPIFHHNAMDILTLACLTAIVPWAFRSPEEAPLRHGAEWLGLARWLLRAEREEQGLRLLRRSIEAGLPDAHLFRTMWDIAMLEKKRRNEAGSLGLLADLAACRNPYRVPALEELAKYYEHRERNYVLALEWTRQALTYQDSDTLRKREARLQERLSRPRPRRLL